MEVKKVYTLIVPRFRREIGDLSHSQVTQLSYIFKELGEPFEIKTFKIMKIEEK